jgi:hypothetical protein
MVLSFLLLPGASSATSTAVTVALHTNLLVADKAAGQTGFDRLVRRPNNAVDDLYPQRLHPARESFVQTTAYHLAGTF